MTEVDARWEVRRREGKDAGLRKVKISYEPFMTAIRLPQNTMRHVPPAMPPANVKIRRRRCRSTQHDDNTRP